MTTGLHPDSLRNAQKLKRNSDMRNGNYSVEDCFLTKKRFLIPSAMLIGLFGVALVLPAPEQEPVKPELFQPNVNNVRNLAISCANKNIKPMLKDPNSFREIQHGYNLSPTTIDVTVDYTATNGFGGRVRNNYTCTYTR